MPQYLIISAGFDTVEGDPAGGFHLTRAGLARIGEKIAALNLPTLIVQEGGYLLDTLGHAAVAFLQPLAARGEQEGEPR
jgi:acetoin utilization deacetylase AcuC-like enzyme